MKAERGQHSSERAEVDLQGMTVLGEAPGRRRGTPTRCLSVVPGQGAAGLLREQVPGSYPGAVPWQHRSPWHACDPPSCGGPAPAPPCAVFPPGPVMSPGVVCPRKCERLGGWGLPEFLWEPGSPFSVPTPEEKGRVSSSPRPACQPAPALPPGLWGEGRPWPPRSTKRG